MHHGVHVVFGEHPRHKGGITDVADDQRRVKHRLAKAGREVVEDDHVLAALAQQQGSMTADVTGAAGD